DAPGPAPKRPEVIRARRRRPPAGVGARPLEIEGYGTIPPITNWVRKLPAVDTAFGIFIPKGVPAEVVTTGERAWAVKIANSDKLKAYTRARSVLFTPMSGKDA